MKKCRRYQDMIEASLKGGEWPPLERDALERHLEECRACRGIARLHARLAKAMESIPEPSPEMFESMRLAVRRRTAPTDLPSRHRLRPRPDGLLPSVIFRPALSLTLAAALAVGGFFLGRTSRSPARLISSILLRDMTKEASLVSGPAAVSDSRYQYSNISLRRLDDGRLDLGFDVATRIRVTDRADSPLVRELLLQATLNSSTTGSRLRALSDIDVLPAGRSRDILIHSLANDSSPVVRRNALSILVESPDSPGIAAAMLRVLRQDDSLENCFEALKYLVEHRADEDAILAAIEEGRPEGRAALSIRATKLLGKGKRPPRIS